jgi:electron transport complex protein RnfG
MRNILTTTVILVLFAIIGTGLVAYTYQQTEEQIAENERQALLQSLRAIIPPDKYDNEIFTDTVQVQAPQMLGSPRPITVYRARKDGKPVAAALTPVAPDGYNGAIKLLVGIYYDGTVAGVRVVSENETPGLGDAIEADRSDWIFSFSGKSLGKPPESKWAVKRDGGVFDQFTGATITPRAVVKAVRKTLVYYRDHRDQLFAKPEKGKTALSVNADKGSTQ